MLSNAYFLAKFRFDTAENERCKILQILPNLRNLANFLFQAGVDAEKEAASNGAGTRHGAESAAPSAPTGTSTTVGQAATVR